MLITHWSLVVEQYSEPVASTWNLVWHFYNSVSLTNSVFYKLIQSISIHCRQMTWCSRGRERSRGSRTLAISISRKPKGSLFSPKFLSHCWLLLVYCLNLKYMHHHIQWVTVSIYIINHKTQGNIQCIWHTKLEPDTLNPSITARTDHMAEMHQK